MEKKKERQRRKKNVNQSIPLLEGEVLIRFIGWGYIKTLAFHIKQKATRSLQALLSGLFFTDAIRTLVQFRHLMGCLSVPHVNRTYEFSEKNNNTNK